MAKPLKTVFLLEDLCFGGTQKQNLALALRLDRERFEPAILTLTGPTDLDADAINGNVKVEHIGASRAVAPFFFARLGKCLARLKPDILVPCTALPNIWGRLWGRWQKIPVIVGTVRGGGAPKRQHEWLLWRLANGIVCNSLPLRDIMLKLGCSETRYIPNGVDFGHFTPATQKQPGKTIVCVARLAKDKDHPTLLGAFAKILRKIPDAKLRFIGEGPEENSLKNLAAQIFSASQAGRVEFAGASHDPAPALAQADIFALSSIREGQPNVILEAMACGLPVCATNVGGIPDLVRDNGLLCEPGDCETLAANLTRLLENPEEGRAMGQAGRNRVERDFSFKSMAQRHEEFFSTSGNKPKLEKKMSIGANIGAACLLGLLAAVPALAQETVVTGNGITTELWEGKALTARFRVGICHDKKGKARGALLLRHSNGQEDIYHLHGELKNDEFFLTHSSGHTLSGTLTGPTSMEGKAKLKSGLRLTLKGSRKLNAPLAASDCAPLP